MRNAADKPQALMDKISILPPTPGVYTYYDAKGTVIYVGKAKNLKRRVSSYFNRRHDCLRTRLLVRAIADMSYIVVPTEQDALNLENSMIKEHQPHYNVLLKDDKSYPWILVTDELYPRVLMTRQRVPGQGRYYGPYTDTGVARTVLQLLHRLYPLRTCRLPIDTKYIERGKRRLCLEYHLKKCGGCCRAMVSPQQYAVYIARVKQILRGDTAELMRYLRQEMQRLSQDLLFEQAQALKEQHDLLERYQSRSVIVSQTIGEVDIFGVDMGDAGAPAQDAYVCYLHVRKGAVVRSLTLHYRLGLDETPEQILSYAIDEVRRAIDAKYTEIVTRTPPQVPLTDVDITLPRRGDKALLLDVAEKNARQARAERQALLEKKDPSAATRRILERIQRDFRLTRLPEHIECFDNSNIQGTNPVASCVVFRQGRPSKKDYRHFNIQTVVGADDFASMREVITRRYTRLQQDGDEALPQLIVVDGGKGQLSAAVEALDEIGLRGQIAIVGIAKRLEEIYFPGDSVPLYIDKNSETLRVIQQLRDEAHRFGITHHRNRRSASSLVGRLDGIRGIGPKTRDLLISHFRSVKRLSEAPEADIAALVGPSKARIVAAALVPTAGTPPREEEEAEK